MNKKGDISLNIIIIAAIGLLVLVILSVIFIGKMGTTSKNVDNCETKSGTCVASASACTNGPTGVPAGLSGKVAPSAFKCFDPASGALDTRVCCLTIS